MFEPYRSQEKNDAPLSGATTQEEKRNSIIKYLKDTAPFVFVVVCLIVLAEWFLVRARYAIRRNEIPAFCMKFPQSP